MYLSRLNLKFLCFSRKCFVAVTNQISQYQITSLRYFARPVALCTPTILLPASFNNFSLISRGPNVLLCFQNLTFRPPFLQSYILCDSGGPDVGGPNVEGPDVRFPSNFKQLWRAHQTIFYMRVVVKLFDRHVNFR